MLLFQSSSFYRCLTNKYDIHLTITERKSWRTQRRTSSAAVKYNRSRTQPERRALATRLQVGGDYERHACAPREIPVTPRVAPRRTGSVTLKLHCFDLLWICCSGVTNGGRRGSFYRVQQARGCKTTSPKIFYD